jgi:hypothetical protein
MLPNPVISADMLQIHSLLLASMVGVNEHELHCLAGVSSWLLVPPRAE